MDEARHEFRRDGELLHLEPQVFALLVCLVRANGGLVSKEALIETVWHNLNVSDATISARINAARTAVGDTGKAQSVIRTVPKRGFQMAVALESDGYERPDAMPVPPAEAPHIGFATSGDGEMIAYSCHGQGSPLVRVGHWLSHLELDWECPVWRPLLDALGQDFTVYRYDQRGTGLSTRNLERDDLDTFVEDLRAVVDANGLERFALFAASQASPVAIRFAALYPERISRLVLYGGYAVGRAMRPAAEDDLDEATILGLIRAGWGQRGSAFLDAFSGLFMPDATGEQTASFVRIQKQSISPDNAARLRQAVDRFEVVEDLPKVQVPTLVVHAREDAIHPIEQGRLIAGAVPNARFIMLDSRNHVPLPQDPTWPRLMSAVRTFCSENEIGTD